VKAADVMVSNVITVGVDASIGEVAATLLNNHISGAPVVDEKGELVGIVSEGDLMRRPEIGTSKRHSWWLELVSNKWASATEYIKSHSRKVADVMTRDVITAKPDTPLGDIAAMLERNRIKRVPIVEGGKLVGIVSRANILQALASATKKLTSLASLDDTELRKKVLSRLASEPWRRPCSRSRFRMAPSICGDLSTRSRRRKQPNSLPKPRLAFAPSSTTSSFNASAMAVLRPRWQPRRLGSGISAGWANFVRLNYDRQNGYLVAWRFGRVPLCAKSQIVQYGDAEST
jgi:CBS domain-containing protein